MSSGNKPYFIFADWKFCPTTSRLEPLSETGEVDNSITLRVKLNQALMLLVNANGQVVTKQTLIEQIWQGNELTGDKGVVDTISALRKTLGQYQGQPIIKTHPKLGYSLVCPVTEHQTEILRDVVKDPITWFKPMLYGVVVACISVLLLLSQVYFVGQSHDKQYLKLEKLLTNQAGMKRWPTMTADQQLLSYVSYFDNPAGDLLLQDNEGQMTKLNLAGGSDGQNTMIISPKWSPDGTLLAYIEQGNTDECLVKVYDRRLRISHSLTTCRFSGFGGLAWSVDSHRLYFNGVNGDQASYMALDIEQDKVEVLFELADGELEVSYAQWLDKEQLFFVKAKSQIEHQLMQYHTETKKAELMITYGPVFGLAIHPTEPIVTVAEMLNESDFAIFDIDVNTKQVEEVDIEGMFLDLTYWSDGRLMLSKYQSKQGIIAADLNTGKQRNLISSVGWNRFPYYSQARQSLTFQSNRDGSVEIWQYEPITEHISQITNNDIGEYFHTWSADGEQMAFLGANFNRNSVLNLHVFDSKTEQIVQLNDGKVESVFPVWSSNGNQITLLKPSQKNINRVYSLDVASGESHEIKGLQSPESVQYVGESLFYFNSQTGYVTEHLPDSEDIRLGEPLQTLDWSNWLVTANELFYVIRGENDEIRRWDRNSNSVQTVVTLPSGSVYLNRSLAFNGNNGILYICVNQSDDGNIGIYRKAKVLD